jgi:tyrosinase
MALARYVSEPIAVPALEEGDFHRADLEFHGVDHSGSSFGANVFLNTPEANETTPRDEQSGYAGSFYVFGHGGCFGDIGHCDVPRGPRGPFDLRLPHQLTPQKRTVTITEPLRRILSRRRETGESGLTVTVVPIASDSPVAAGEDLFRFERLALVTYA